MEFQRRIEKQLQSTDYIEKQAQLHLDQKFGDDGYDEDSESGNEEEVKTPSHQFSGFKNLLSSIYGKLIIINLTPFAYRIQR